MKDVFKTSGEVAINAEETPEVERTSDALKPTRPLRKQDGKVGMRPEARKEGRPEVELPKELAETTHLISKTLERIQAWEKNIRELQKETDQLRSSGEVKILFTNIYTSLGPVPFLGGKLAILARRLKSNPHEPPLYELGLFEGDKEHVGQLEILKSTIEERSSELAKLQETAELAREDILGDLERGGSTAARKDLVARMLRDFQAATSQRIFELLRARIYLEKKIFEEATLVVDKVRQHFSAF